MLRQIQGVIDLLADGLQRSVLVEGPEFEFLACSRHYGDADAVRLACLTDRVPSPPVADYLRDCSVHLSETPIEVKANPELKMLARYCVPLRSESTLFGFMWVIASLSSLTEKEITLCKRVADLAVEILEKQATADEHASWQLEETAAKLLEPGVDITPISNSLMDAKYFTRPGGFAVVVLMATTQSVPTVPGVWEMAQEGIAAVMRSFPPGDCLFIRRDDFAVLIVGGLDDQGSRLKRAMQAMAEVFDSHPELLGRGTIGIGEVVPSLHGVVNSYKQARAAALGGLATENLLNYWQSVDLYGFLMGLGLRRPVPELTPKIVTAIEQLDNESKKLLEEYLDSGNSAVLTAQRMFMHRTSVYSKIDRIEKSLGLDLADGKSRLLAHVWLKVRALPRFEE